MEKDQCSVEFEDPDLLQKVINTWNNELIIVLVGTSN